jgi:hypothetical protein
MRAGVRIQLKWHDEGVLNAIAAGQIGVDVLLQFLTGGRMFDPWHCWKNDRSEKLRAVEGVYLIPEIPESRVDPDQLLNLGHLKHLFATGSCGHE